MRYLHVQTAVDPLHILWTGNIHRCPELPSREGLIIAQVFCRLCKVGKRNLMKRMSGLFEQATELAHLNM